MIQPYTYIYFRELGFTFTQIASFTSAMMISLFIFEVPTGIVADLYGRKKSVFIGLLITGAAPIIISLSNNYFIILVSYIFIGLGITFISGAEDALIVDNLKFHKREDLIKEYYIKMSSFMGLGTVVAFLLGSLIVKMYGIKPLWYIWGIGYLFSAVLLLFIKEFGFVPHSEKVSYLKKIITPVKSSFNFIRSNKTFLNYLIGSTILTVMFVQRDLWNIFLTENGVPQSSLSIIAAITSIFIIFLPWLSKSVLSIKRALIFTTILRVLILISALFINNSTVMLGVILFIILGSLSSFESPLTSTFIQSQIDSKNRATIGSVMSMMYSVVGAVAGLFIGLVTDFIGIRYSIALFSIFGVISIIFYSRMSYSSHKEAKYEI